MLSIVLAGSLLAVSPPALPEDQPAAPVDAGVDAVEDAGVEAAPVDATPEPGSEAIVVDAIIVEPPADALPVAIEVGPDPVAPVVIVERKFDVIPQPPPVRFVTAPPWSGAGRFVGGSVMLIAGTGLLTAATLEFADGRDTTKPVISHVPAGVAMLVAGGIMIGTAARDQRRLSEWEASTGINARPSGNGLIISGVTVTTLGAMAAIATSIASDMDLDAPLSIPAGWATAGIALGGGTALLVAGIVRRSRYGKWRDGLRGVPMVAPSRAGATVGFVGQF